MLRPVPAAPDVGAGARSWANAQLPNWRWLPASAPLVANDRDSDDGGAYRLLGSLTTPSQLTSKMLPDRSDKQAPEPDTWWRSGERTREPTARSAPTARGTPPTTTSGGRAPPGRTRSNGLLPGRGGRPRVGRREPRLVCGGSTSGRSRLPPRASGVGGQRGSISSLGRPGRADVVRGFGWHGSASGSSRRRVLSPCAAAVFWDGLRRSHPDPRAGVVHISLGVP